MDITPESNLKFSTIGVPFEKNENKSHISQNLNKSCTHEEKNVGFKLHKCRIANFLEPLN